MAIEAETKSLLVRNLRNGLAGMAAGLIGAAAHSETIYACVNSHSGEMKIVAANTTCGKSRVPIQWQTESTGGGVPTIQYVFGGMYPGTSVARAFCPTGTKVTGGGGYSLSGVGLKYSFPIADETGLNAYGSTAIAWQVAATDWSDVQAFVVCAGP